MIRSTSIIRPPHNAGIAKAVSMLPYMVQLFALLYNAGIQPHYIYFYHPTTSKSESVITLLLICVHNKLVCEIKQTNPNYPAFHFYKAISN